MTVPSNIRRSTLFMLDFVLSDYSGVREFMRRANFGTLMLEHGVWTALPDPHMKALIAALKHDGQGLILHLRMDEVGRQPFNVRKQFESLAPNIVGVYFDNCELIQPDKLYDMAKPFVAGADNFVVQASDGGLQTGPLLTRDGQTDWWWNAYTTSEMLAIMQERAAYARGAGRYPDIGWASSFNGGYSTRLLHHAWVEIFCAAYQIDAAVTVRMNRASWSAMPNRNDTAYEIGRIETARLSSDKIVPPTERLKRMQPVPGFDKFEIAEAVPLVGPKCNRTSNAAWRDLAQAFQIGSYIRVDPNGATAGVPVCPEPVAYTCDGVPLLETDQCWQSFWWRTAKTPYESAVALRD